ncbi:hypothetical protein [Phenylobacterium sp. RIFCSPHIGHO2_01_FULL_69_31]|uniref:hypothetical protein n=1 Tax=Phenylobacterium sp. RIFCSPHIGHO2_01_FULL_69_31 TaxID=1801944 RepID=UPI0025E4050D|nr:hypothetical protein [Phenylobacterium sp. RIFCSPHIGHO2_01_FULL_69_31]
MTTYQLPPFVWPTALMSVCALAAWRGRDVERLAAAGYLAAWALTLVAFRAGARDIQWSVMIIDVALLGLLFGIALKSRRYWPLFSGAFQLLAVATHVAVALDSGVSGWAYQTAGIIWGYLVIAAIGYGAWTAPRRYAEIEAMPDSDVPGATRR